MSELDSAVVAYAAEAVKECDARWTQLTESLNAQIKTHKDAEADAIKRAGMLNAEIADMKAKLAEVERENKLAAEQYELLRINVRFP